MTPITRRATHPFRVLIRARAGLSWIALLVSVAGSTALALQWSWITSGAGFSADARVYLGVALAAGLAGSLWVFGTSNAVVTRITFFFRFATVLVITVAPSIGLAPVLLIALALLLDVGISEDYPVNVVLTVLAAIIISLLFQSSSGAGAPEHAAARNGERLSMAVLLVAASAIFSLATKYREDLIREQGHTSRLDSAVMRLSEANIGYQEYVSRAEQASMLEERKRITRDIHDTIGYTMTNNIMMMEAAAEMVKRDPEGVQRLMQTARESAQEGLDEIRNALHLLRAQEDPAPTSIDAIVKMIQAFRDATGTEVDLQLGNAPICLNPEIEAAVYHLVREALTNSFRHGKATAVRVQFWKTEDSLKIVVWDNGVGSGEIIQAGIGISGMRERLRAVSGTLSVGSTPGGFQVAAIIPDPLPANGGRIDD